MWSLCSLDFHTFTLQLPIQTLHSVAPELQVFVRAQPRGVLVSVNCDCFSPSRFSHFHCNAMRKAIKAHKNLHTNQQNEHTPAMCMLSLLGSNYGYVYHPQQSWGKVMFLQASVIMLTGRGACMDFWGAGGVHGFSRGACMVFLGVHGFWGGMHSFFGEVCVVFLGDMCGFFRGHAWFFGGHEWFFTMRYGQ